MKQLLIMLALATATAGGVFAQATELTYDHRVQGDRAMTIQLGVVRPEFFSTFDGRFASVLDQLTYGGTMGLDLDFYLNNHVTLGGGLKGMAAYGVNGTALFMVPITFRAGYEFQFSPFSVPVTLGAGFCFTNYGSDTSFDPVVIPTVGFFWNMSSTWSFGVNTSQWVVFQPFYNKVSDSRIGYFADATLAAVYHF